VLTQNFQVQLITSVHNLIAGMEICSTNIPLTHSRRSLSWHTQNRGTNYHKLLLKILT